MKEIYLFSGLGADKRVFDFLDLTNYDVTHISWIDPQPNERIENYAKRLSEQIKSSRPIFIGVSFGGMVAIEVSKWVTPEKVILISSATARTDLPFYFRMIGTWKLHRVVPTKMFKAVNALTYWFFGAKTDAEKKLLQSIINDTEEKFLAWAINAILTWRNSKIPNQLFSIHGTSDRILPPRKADFLIENGGHLAIVTDAKKVSELIRTVIQ